MSNKFVKFAAVGDIALSHKYDDLLVKNGPGHPFYLVRDTLNAYDIVFGNLEAPFCVEGVSYPHKCSLKADPEYLSGIKDAGFNILSISNNHILDYKEKAFFETIEMLKKHEINCFGAGRDLEAAIKPIKMDAKGISIGFLAYCDVQIDSPYYAKPSERGISPFNIQKVMSNIRQLKTEVDIVIVSLHWGVENYSYPTPEQVQTAHQIIDAGADLIIGHHPHVLQGIEKYKGGLIVYSLGNFIFSDIDWTWVDTKGQSSSSLVKLTKMNRQTMILTVEFSKNGISNFQIIPCAINQAYQPQICRRKKNAQKKIRKISKRITSKNYETFWKRYEWMTRKSELFYSNFRRIKNLRKIKVSHIYEFIGLMKSFIRR